jgi:flagellar basal body-associated protein FliL
MNIANHKKSILIIIVILLAFFGYWYVFVSKKDALTKSTAQSSNQNLRTQVNISDTPYDKEFVSSLLGLNSVSLDVTIFESKVYKALNYPEIPFVINYSTESGRSNPFLPIGVNSESVNIDNLEQINTNETTSSSTQPIPTTLKDNKPASSKPASTTTPAPTPKRF